MPSMFVLALLAASSAAADPPWPDAAGAGDLAWGTSALPLESQPRDRSSFLPDAGFIGARPGDKPTDIELPGPHPGDERRYLRYVHGALVDAWVVKNGQVDTSPWRGGSEEWRGPVLGPASDGWRAFGDATSWRLGQRTAMHWRDRTSDREILAVRAAGGTTNKSVRARVVENQAPPPTLPAKLKGDLKSQLKPHADALSGCLNQADKPIHVVLQLAFDDQGRPGRIKVETDKVAPDVVDCMAGVVGRMGGVPGSIGTATLQRIR
ncbi:MAG: hypothetical protein VX265_06570 [Myxococcota bacterium]|nr:hypothetical protein [Myxococcota bacterium]